MQTPKSIGLKCVLVVLAALLARQAVAQNNNANLHSLTLSVGTLNPAFETSIFIYSASVPNYVPSVTVTPTAISSSATIEVQINGGGFSSVASGSPSGPLALNVGTNSIDTRVTSGNLSVIKTYTVALTRNLPAPPDVQTLAAVVAAGTATLNGAAHPQASSTAAWFEWGVTTNYGNATPHQPVGGGTTTTNFSQNLSLPPSGTFHFRAVASNNVGVAFGQDAVAVSQLFTAGTDINLITGPEIWPRVTQNEPAIWSHGDTIVVAYNDSRALAPVGPTNTSFGGASVSTNGGVSFARLNYSFNQFGHCGGRPSVFYSSKAGKWYIAFLSEACGDPGIGLWESTDGINWAHTICLPRTSPLDPNHMDGPSTWVDNNSGSTFYGRQYVAFNDFNAPSPLGFVRVSFSVNNGTNWIIPPPLDNPPYTNVTRRAGKITGSHGSDGTVFLPILDESRGGTNLTRIHYLARSTNGGGGWTLVQVVAPVPGPGRSTSGYWAGMYDAPTPAYWREMGWGQAGVGPGGVVHYAYSASTTNEPYDANIFYTRSTNNGITWSAPIQLNTDQSLQRQWNPSVSVNPNGIVFVSWYDERKSPGDLEYYGRVSLDNGVNWGVDAPISDAPFRRPFQGDPLVATNFFGLYTFSAFSDDGYGDIAYRAWVDGRVVIDNFYVQQDVFFDRITFGSELRITSIARAENGDVILVGTGRPNLSHSLQASTSLSVGSFSNVTTVVPSAFGVWTYNTGTVVPGRRFFRLALP